VLLLVNKDVAANLAMIDLSSNRLIIDLLTSISLRTLRYIRLGLAANPERLHSSLKTWRALPRAVERRDIPAVLETAQKRIEGPRDSAMRAIAPPPSAARGRAGAGAPGAGARLEV
jgi:DNA-binding GntR family transcriptional regulator